MSFLSNRRGLLWIGSALAVVALGAAIYIATGSRGKSTSAAAAEKIVIATTLLPGSAPLYVAMVKGFFDREVLAVELMPVTSGKAGLVAVMEKKAGYVTAAEIPLALAAMSGQKFAIVATFYSGGRDHGIVARKDRGVAAISDLRGKKVGVVPGTTSAFLLDLILSSGGMTRGDVESIALLPEQMPAAMAGGTLDAASAWNPALGSMQRQLGPNGVTFDGQGLFSYDYVLAGRQDFVSAHPDTARKMFRALVAAMNFIKSSPEEARRITAATAQLDDAMVRESWDTYRFRLTLDQSLIASLDDVSRWAITNKLTNASQVPNYLDFIATDALRSVDPAAVTLIH